MKKNQPTNPHNQFTKTLQLLEKIIFDLNKTNILKSIESVMNLYNENISNYFNLWISRLIYSSFILHFDDFGVYVSFIKEIFKNKKVNSNQKIIETFTNFLLGIESQESNYLLEQMIELNLISSSRLKKKTEYFAHYTTKHEDINMYRFYQSFNKNYEKLSKNDWELHKKYIKEGHNPNEIAKIIRNDDIEKLQEISSQNNFDFNQSIEPSLYERCSFVNDYYVTLIDYAAFFSAVKCFKYLLMNGASVENTGEYAVAGGNLEIIHLCEQNHSSFEGAFEAAIQFHRNDIFYYLYENKIVKRPVLSIFLFIKYNFFNIELFNFLITKKEIHINEIADDGETALMKASWKGYIEIVKLLLEKRGIDVNYEDIFYGKTALMYASDEGHIEIVKLLLEQKGIDVNAKNYYGKTALIIASDKGYTEIVKLLLEQERIDINDKDDFRNTALILASSNGHTEIVKLLLEQEGIDINAQGSHGNTALLCALKNNHVEIVKLLFKQEGIDVNARDSEGRTALIDAYIKDKTEIFKLLLGEKSIDFFSQDKKGETLLMLAVKNDIELVKFLLKQNGVDINLKNKFGETALMKASLYGQREIIKLLLKQEGIDVNAIDKNGETALMYAVKYGYIKIVKLFLEQEGININIKNNDGKTSLMIASDNGSKKIKKLLKEFENNANTQSKNCSYS